MVSCKNECECVYFCLLRGELLVRKVIECEKGKRDRGGQVTKGGGVDCIYTRREYLQGCCVQKNRSVGHSSGNPILTAIIEMMMAVFPPFRSPNDDGTILDLYLPHQRSLSLSQGGLCQQGKRRSRAFSLNELALPMQLNRFVVYNTHILVIIAKNPKKCRNKTFSL